MRAAAGKIKAAGLSPVQEKVLGLILPARVPDGSDLDPDRPTGVVGSLRRSV
jgi:hypothetical protein